MDSALRAHVEDLLEACYQRDVPRFSFFMDEHARALSEPLCSRWPCRCVWFGGWDGAERNVLGVFPETMEPDTGIFPIRAFRTPLPKGVALTHRDFLGAILALGIKREVVGDILIEEHSATFFLLAQAAPLVLQELQRVGKAGVKLCDVTGEPIAYTQRFVETVETVSSLRLDCVTAAAARCSRGEAAERIVSGMVSVNGLVQDRVSYLLRDGDKLSVRGKGKFLLGIPGTTTRKGRLLVALKRYD